VRRVLPVLVGVVIVLAGLYGLVSLFQGRDSAGVGDSKTASGPGTLEPAGASGNPPTSGSHAKANPTSERRLSKDALLTALELGDVVIVHAPGRTPTALKQLQDDVSGPFDPELAAAGQMVIVTPWPGVDDVEALAYRRRLRASSATDPQLKAFADAWLGVGRSGG
jgi:hypothetical protein